VCGVCAKHRHRREQKPPTMNTKTELQLSPEKRVELVTQLVIALLDNDDYYFEGTKEVDTDKIITIATLFLYRIENAVTKMQSHL
jgi:hypothetical protein